MLKVLYVASEAVPFVKTGGLADVAGSLPKELKQKGLWLAGADMDGTENYYDANMTGPLVLVIGSEGRGVSRLTKNACDFIVKIPMRGKVNSLNASNAAAILAYEVLKQRTLK